MLINYCGISGGKDSAATALWMIHESGYDPASIRFAFCNTHNEHALTFEHIGLLSDRFVSWGTSPIVYLEPERGFFDLAKWKQRFPSRKARFCTQWLKVIPTRNDILRLLREGREVLLHSGVRAEENKETRANLPIRGFDDGFGCEVFRPILNWTIEDVVAYHKRFGVPLNPLYAFGARRVGCFPCINSAKKEIEMIADKFPERINEIRKQEIELSSTFFGRKTTPLRFRSKEVSTRKGPMRVPTIDDVVEWSHTDRGGKKHQPGFFDDDRTGLCISSIGFCE